MVILAGVGRRIPSRIPCQVVLFALYSNVGVLAMRSPKAIQAAAGDPHQNPRIAVVLAILFFLLLVPLLYRIFIYREKAIFDRGFVLMLLFTVPLLLSSLFARDTNIALSELADYFVEGLALYLLISNSLRDSATLRKAIWALLLAGSLMGGLSLLQKATHTQRSIYGGLAQVESDFQSNPRMPQVAARAEAANRVADNGEVEGQVRSAGPIGETNRYGQILLVLLPLAALQFGTEKSRRMRNIAILAGALILGGLLLTLSRGTLLAALIAFALMGFMRLLPARQILKALLAITVFVLIFQPGVISRMATLERLEGLVSSSHRTQAPDSSRSPAAGGRTWALRGLLFQRLWQSRGSSRTDKRLPRPQSLSGNSGRNRNCRLHLVHSYPGRSYLQPLEGAQAFGREEPAIRASCHSVLDRALCRCRICDIRPLVVSAVLMAAVGVCGRCRSHLPSRVCRQSN